MEMMMMMCDDFLPCFCGRCPGNLMGTHYSPPTRVHSCYYRRISVCVCFSSFVFFHQSKKLYG
jgi:hypothetical protein